MSKISTEELVHFYGEAARKLGGYFEPEGSQAEREMNNKHRALLRRVKQLEEMAAKGREADETVGGWDAWDVLEKASEIGKRITRAEAKQVLDYMLNKGDANLGFNWDFVEIAIAGCGVGRPMTDAEDDAYQLDNESRKFESPAARKRYEKQTAASH
jgi:hypothetical protein